MESRPSPGCPDWASVGAEASAAAGVVLLDPPGPGQRVGAAGWWVLQDDPTGQEPSAAAPHPVTAAWGAERASAEAGPPEVSDQGLEVWEGGRTVASEPEVSLPGFAEESPDQKEVSGLEEHPDLEAVAGPQVLG